MARLFPVRSEPDQTEGHPRIVDLEGEDADAVFSALSSTTARRIYARLDAKPGTPSDVADAIDSSIQNVRYHLENLEGAGLVEVVDTWYSSRGNEMSVYATTDGPLIVTSDESTASRLREALSRFVGGITALAAGSVVVQYGLTRWAESAVESTGEPTPAGTDDEATPETDDEPSDDVGAQDLESEEEVDESLEEPPELTDDGADTATDAGAEVAEVLFSTVPPGLLFFLGGLVVLLAVLGYWYWYRPAY